MTDDSIIDQGRERASGPSTGKIDAWSLLSPLVCPEMKRVLEGINVNRLSSHSGGVVPGTVFFCLPGEKDDGHHYTREAASRGAVVIVASRPVELEVPLVLVSDTRLALSQTAARFFGFPAEKMNLVGVTGTNGKTTTTYFIHSIFRAAGRRAAILGSNGLYMNGCRRSFRLTTPESLELQESLAYLYYRGAEVVAMEASSHALVQQRLAHCSLDCAVFTNLTREHLDYHRTMDDYLQAKCRIFGLLKEKPGATAVLNADDASFHQVNRAASDYPRLTYGIKSVSADIRAAGLSVDRDGRYSFRLLGWPGTLHVSLKIPGLFTVYNALAAAATAMKEGLKPEDVDDGLNDLSGVPGRLEEIRAGKGFTVIIDFAHTPDGLEQVLKMLRRRSQARLITLFGCPGERDHGKRPVMGRIAERYSDGVVLTADNPAGEKLSTIIDQIRAGMKEKPVIIEDRSEAINFVLSRALPGDQVLIAGKGNEDYQLVGNRYLPHNDRAVVEAYLLSHPDKVITS